MNNELGEIVGSLKDHNMQESMRDGKVLQTINKDYKLAMYFYNFLSEKSDGLPTYDFIDKVIELHELNNNHQLISLGCGISVTANIVGNDKYLSIEYAYPVNESVLRLDQISSDSYVAYMRTVTDMERLDTNEFPMFKKQRISYLQSYLKLYQYNNSKNNEERQK